MMAAPSQRIEVRTTGCLELTDLTLRIEEIVRSSSIRDGAVIVQSLHTTAAIVINESEPLLLEDLKSFLEKAAPQSACYRHDDFDLRTENMTPDERPNGHAHCKALLLPTSVTIGLSGGRLLLGRWQRVFLVELDHARSRQVAVVPLGPLAPAPPRERERGSAKLC